MICRQALKGEAGHVSSGGCPVSILYLDLEIKQTMYHPTFDEVTAIASDLQAHPGKKQRTQCPLLPLCCDLLADTETPVSAYCKTARGPYSFLLESVASGERIARYSFIGIDPYLVLTHRGETATLRY